MSSCGDINSSQDSSDMESSSQDNIVNDVIININNSARNNSSISSNRALIQGLNSGSVSMDEDCDEQEHYGDHTSPEGKLMNNNPSRLTDSTNSSPMSRPGSSERGIKSNDLDPGIVTNMEIIDSSYHRTNGVYDRNGQNSQNCDQNSPSTTVRSRVSPLDATFSEHDSGISCNRDSAIDHPQNMGVSRNLKGEINELRNFVNNNERSRCDINVSRNLNGGCQELHNYVNNVDRKRCDIKNSDHFGPSAVEARHCNGEDVELSHVSSDRSQFSTSSNSSCSPPTSSANKFVGESISVRLNSTPDVTSRSTADEDARQAKADVKKDSRKRPFSSLGQGHNEHLSRKSIVNGAIAGTRSLPIHCLIEQSSNEADNVSWSSEEFHVVNDTYAILPGNILLSDIVWSSLSRLGYSNQEAMGATGGIQLKNWQTLDFDVITNNADATVEEMLGELMSVATLRIRLASNISEDPQEAVKQKLVQLLFGHSKDFLLASGCPVEKTHLDAIATGNLSQLIPEPVCNAFNAWYNQRIEQKALEEKNTSKGDSSQKPTFEKQPKPSRSSSMALSESDKSDASDTDKPSMPSASMSQAGPPPLISSLFCTSSSSIKGNKKNEMSSMNNGQYLNQSIKPDRIHPKLDLPLSPQQGHQENHQKPCPLSQYPSKHEMMSPIGQKMFSDHHFDRLEKSSLSANDASQAINYPPHSSNPYMGIMPGKTRIRTSFDPEHEIPRLQKWFSDNQHPTREQMMRFMQELNTLESRKGRRPLDLTNIIYWFKNARAAQRRATKAMDDSFENEENLDVSNSGSGGANGSETIPPYLPNKNAVYMIPFHPYPHLMSRSGNPGSSENGMNGLGSGISSGCDEPYDLTVTKRRSSESGKSSSGNETGSGESCGDHVNFYNSLPSPKMSPESSDDSTFNRDTMKKKMSGQCPPPRFPALLDVVSKMRREIPPTSEDVYNNNSNNTNNILSNASMNENNQASPSRPCSRSSDVDKVHKTEDLEQSCSDQSIHHRENGFIMSSHHMQALKMKCEERRYESDAVIPKNKKHFDFDCSPELEIGQIKKEMPISQSNGNINCSDDDNSNDSYDSEEEMKMRMKQNVADYASAMHNNVSRLTAANMAALSLAQMGQPLHIPQLAPSLAMAYYPMDPRFYSQPPVSTSLPSSSSPTPTSTHLTPHQGQTTPNSLLDSSSPLPSPSSMQHSMGQHNQHHLHQRQQHQQQQSPRHHSEPRKRRTRVFIDPLSEIPKLEKWFKEDTHPSAFMIDKYCEELNKCEYRQKFPKLEPKNVQLWFKNHRAKVKRLKVSFNGKYEEGDEYAGEIGMDGEGDIKSESFDFE